MEQIGITINHYLVLSLILFFIGAFGVLLRRNLIIIFLCLELMLCSANLAIITFSRMHTSNNLPNIDGHILTLFVIAIAAAEVAIGLALFVSLFYKKQDASIENLTSLKN